MSITRLLIALLLVIAIYGGGNFYAAKRIYQFLIYPFPFINIKIYICVFVFIVSTLFLGFLPLPLVIIRIFNFISAYWMGIFMYLILLFFSADILILIGRITNIIHVTMLNNIRFFSGLAVIIVTAGLIIYGLINANLIKIVNYEIEFNDTSLNDLKIVLISDTHLGDVNSERNLERLVKSINSLTPDIVCITGDIFNDNFYLIRNPDRAISLFKSINATYGVYACLGNHDGGNTFNQMIKFLENSNIKLLNDEYVIIDNRFVLFGRLDTSPIGGFGELQRRDISETIISAGVNMPVIVMEHNPSHIKEYGNEVNLILAGHTHSGQMFPGNLVTKAMFVAAYGHYQENTDSPHVIVTSGVSTWRPPMRIGTKNEIVSILVR